MGQVITALAEGKTHVAYRDSKLTHILKDSLGGNCKTTLIVNCSPHEFNREETINSLRFGVRCKLIENKAQVNKIYSNSELMQMVKTLQKQNTNLKQIIHKRAYASVMFGNEKLGLKSVIDNKEMDDDDDVVFEHTELQDKFLKKKKGATALPGLMEDYNELEAKYKEREAQMTDLKTENEGLREDLRNVKLDKVNADEKKAIYSKKLDELHNENATLKANMETKDETIKRLQNEMNQVSDLKQKAEFDVRTLQSINHELNLEVKKTMKTKNSTTKEFKTKLKDAHKSNQQMTKVTKCLLV